MPKQQWLTRQIASYQRGKELFVLIWPPAIVGSKRQRSCHVCHGLLGSNYEKIQTDDAGRMADPG